LGFNLSSFLDAAKRYDISIRNLETGEKMMKALPLTGTFLDEITHDIPSQNWGSYEWEQDFQAMKSIGIDTVILIRSGFRKWLTFPSKVLISREGCHRPSTDLVDLFLKLAGEYKMDFFFGTYDSGKYWHRGEYQKELDLNLSTIEEVWKKYGDREAFKGWYLTQEVSRRTKGIIDLYTTMGLHCKNISGGKLPVLISPWMDGIKSVSSFGSKIYKDDGITIEEHEKEWDEIMDGIKDGVDIVAFQDGHVGFHELGAYLEINKKLAESHNLQCWTNSETFDRDMPVKFLPIKWEKLLLKLQTASQVGIQKGITFEFSHFMSPNSCYLQARNLYARYREFFKV
jgi:hypothetical protein